MENPQQVLPIIRPTLPLLEDVLRVVEQSYSSGTVTVGQVVRDFEGEIRAFCSVRNAVALANCTSGLILSLAALEIPEGSEVILPSFTFAATVEAVIWNRLIPVYVDCLPGTMTIDATEVEKAITGLTAAIVPVTIYGLPPDVEELERISQAHSIPLVFDSAQGLGSTYKARSAGGFGLCEVFSLSPTKVVTAVEGGALTTNDDALAEKIRAMRDYGKGPDGEDMVYLGLSARISELHAAVGLLSLRNAEALISARLQLIQAYRERLGRLPGCRVQEFPADRTSSGNYFTLFIGPKAAVDRDSVFSGLKRLGIQSKRYFHPPVHAQTAFAKRSGRVVGDLPNTWIAAKESLALPLYSHMTADELDKVCTAVESLFAKA